MKKKTDFDVETAVSTMPQRAPVMSRTRKPPIEATLAQVVHQILYPDYISFIDVQQLALLSKRMIRRLDERKEVVEHVCKRLDLPRHSVSASTGAPQVSHYWKTKLTTIFKARTAYLSSTIDNPVQFQQEVLRNWDGYMYHRVGGCCGICFGYDQAQFTYSNLKVRRIRKSDSHVAYIKLCKTCCSAAE